MTRSQVNIQPFGDSALLVSFAQRIEPEINAQVHALAARIAARLSGAAWGTPVPAYASLLAPFDPLLIDSAAAEESLRQLLQQSEEDEHSQPPADLPLLDIPVIYGGEHGPDLGAVAEATGLTPAEVIQLHSGRLYRAYFLGFAPGFAYLASLPSELQLPRRATPRQRVPAGSVAIAGEQTAIYPLATPGGWHVLGRTELTLWDVEREPPALIRSGQRLRFVPQAG